MRLTLRKSAWLVPPAVVRRGAMPSWQANPAQPKRILILSVSAGAGHTRAAEALAWQANGNEQLLATHVDVMDFVTPLFKRFYVDFYLALVSHYPTLWGMLYRFMQDADTSSLLQRLRRKGERYLTRSLHAEIARQKPDVIICTHFLPVEILSHHIQQAPLPCPVWVQVTDYDVHPMWVQRGMAGYFAANEEVAFRMRALGLAGAQIHVSGIPLMPAFARAPTRAACAYGLGIDAQRLTLLLMGGGAGLGKLVQVAQQLLAMDADFQLIVMAGRNALALAQLKQLALAYPGRLFPQAFTDKVERVMACADLAITKPGGLTSAECLAMGLPMILTTPIPGQEERNADYLIEQGAALKACDTATLAYRLRTLLEHPSKLKQMRASALAIGRAGAAQDVIDAVLRRVA